MRCLKGKFVKCRSRVVPWHCRKHV